MRYSSDPVFRKMVDVLRDDPHVDLYIKFKTAKFVDTNGNPKHWSKCGFKKEPTAKVKPKHCRHCDRIMTTTGKLPKKNDHSSWYYWTRFETQGQGIRKVHKIIDSHDAGICTECHELFNSLEWNEEGGK